MAMRHGILGMATLAAIVAVFSLPPIGQGSGYHGLADSRTLVGIPNGLDVISNIPFAIVGTIGLITLARMKQSCADRRDIGPYVALFGGVVLTAICSAYYHLRPDNDRLVWDRLPMTIGFMGLLTAVISERVSARAGRVLLGPLIVAGVGTVLYWYWTELSGAGDLRPYAIVQFGSLAMVALMLALYPGRVGGTRYLVAGLGIYALSKGFELADPQIFSFGGLVSGHALKHLAAAAGVGCIVLMLRQRIEPGQSVPARAA
jgi:hypothetical protein